MRLQRLILENFQGIHSLELDFGGKNATIYGDNATGKTTVYNAVTWLLFDKASTGAKSFTPKTQGRNGDVHNLNHSAEAVFTKDNGEGLELKKCFHEVYKKKKGSPAEEFSGHTTDYFVNGVPAKEKEYQAAIADICDAELMKILTMPSYFSEDMPWSERREMLLEVCGDVNDEDVIAEVPDLKEKLRIPGTDSRYYTPDEFRKAAAPKKTAINKELGEIPSRIDEAQRSLDSLSTTDDNEIARQTAEAETELKKVQKLYEDTLRGDTGGAELTKELTAAKTELEKIKGKHAQQAAKANNEIQLKITEAEGEKLARSVMRDNLNKQKIGAEAEYERLQRARTELLREYTETAALQFDEQSTVCPTCGRAFPKEKAEELRSKFNIDKSEKLAEINRRGKTTASKEMVEAARGEVIRIDAELEKADNELARAAAYLDDIKLHTKAFEPSPVESTEEYIQCSAKIEEIQRRIDNVGEERCKLYGDIASRMQAAQDRLDKLHAEKKAKEAAREIKGRISELEQRERELAAEYEELEETLYLCDEFTRAKVSRLTEKINDRFKNVRFRLFKELINGGIQEDCEVLIPADGGVLVPYTFANNAARINAGLEIINALSEYRGVSLPVFIDNAESVTRLANTDIQMIRLAVSERDKVLRLEVKDT